MPSVTALMLNGTAYSYRDIRYGGMPQLRVIRPISVDHTELRTYVLAPIGEPASSRAARLRQFEDFINPCGFATPDDIAMFSESQKGLGAQGIEWLQAHERGISALPGGSRGLGAELGFAPHAAVRGEFEMQPETATHSFFREWSRRMQTDTEPAPPAERPA